MDNKKTVKETLLEKGKKEKGTTKKSTTKKEKITNTNQDSQKKLIGVVIVSIFLLFFLNIVISANNDINLAKNIKNLSSNQIDIVNTQGKIVDNQKMIGTSVNKNSVQIQILNKNEQKLKNDIKVLNSKIEEMKVYKEKADKLDQIRDFLNDNGKG